MTMRKTLIAALTATTALWGVPALALDPGTPSPTDERVFTYTYAPNQIYEVRTAIGFTTLVRFGGDEVISSAAAGDANAWAVAIAKTKDYVAIKPKTNPIRPTNLLVTMNSGRVYQLSLVPGDETGDRRYMLTATFEYPNSLSGVDALNRALEELEQTRKLLEEQRQRNAEQGQRYEELVKSFDADKTKLALEEQRIERLKLENALEAAQSERANAVLTRDELQQRLDALDADKERQVYDVLQGRLSSAESQKTARERRISELEAQLLDRERAAMEREEARLQRELAQGREDRAARLSLEQELAALRKRQAAMELERQDEQTRQAMAARLKREADERARRERERAARRSNVVFDAFAGQSDTANPTAAPIDYSEGAADRREPDRAFLDDAASRQFDTATAVQITDLDSKVLQGEFLEGVLETAIDSQLSGQVRAILTRPVWSADGSRILADRGSRLVGEYRSFVRFGNDRVLIAWNRMTTADGVSVALGSPGTDALGRAGVEGYADSHFMERFGAAALLSVIGAGSTFLVAQASDEFIVDGSQNVSDDANEQFGRIIDPYIDIPTTVYVDQGTAIRVFLARDLDFSNVR